MIDPELLKILCCPETHQRLDLAGSGLIQEFNRRIAAGTVINRAGAPVKEPVDGGLVREDRKFLYPIRGGIPVLLIDEGLPLPAEADQAATPL